MLGGYYNDYLVSLVYHIIQMLGGWLSDKYGARHVLGTGMLIGGILSALTPIAARLHHGLLIALRVIMGFTMVTIIIMFCMLYCKSIHIR